MAGKVIGGLKGGARRAVLGDISNSGHQPKVVSNGKANVDKQPAVTKEVERQPLGIIHQQQSLFEFLRRC